MPSFGDSHTARADSCRRNRNERAPISRHMTKSVFPKNFWEQPHVRDFPWESEIAEQNAQICTPKGTSLQYNDIESYYMTLQQAAPTNPTVARLLAQSQALEKEVNAAQKVVDRHTGGVRITDLHVGLGVSVGAGVAAAIVHWGVAAAASWIAPVLLVVAILALLFTAYRTARAVDNGAFTVLDLRTWPSDAQIAALESAETRLRAKLKELYEIKVRPAQCVGLAAPAKGIGVNARNAFA
jgi:hypothetical protein